MIRLKRYFPVFALAVCLFLAGFVSPFASGLPGGLEKVASDLGFKGKEAAGMNIIAIAPDYTFPGAPHKSLAGVFGALAALALGAGAGYLMALRARR